MNTLAKKLHEEKVNQEMFVIKCDHCSASASSHGFYFELYTSLYNIL